MFEGLESKLSVATIKNYCVAIKTLYAEWGLIPVLKEFDAPAWRFMMKGLAYSTDPRQDNRAAMTFGDLEKMVKTCKKDKSFMAITGGADIRVFWIPEGVEPCPGDSD